MIIMIIILITEIGIPKIQITSNELITYQGFQLNTYFHFAGFSKAEHNPVRKQTLGRDWKKPQKRKATIDEATNWHCQLHQDRIPDSTIIHYTAQT